VSTISLSISPCAGGQEDADGVEVTGFTGIGQIVARPTFNQSLKGILSAGILRSLRYVIPKLKKKFSAAK